MKFTKVKNPIDKEVALLFKGHTYTIGAGKTESFPEDVAKHFVTIYGFMTLEGSSVEDTAPVVEEVPEVEVAVEDVVEKKVTKVKAPKKK